MLDQNYISQEQYDEALADDVYSRIQAAQIKNSSTENTVYTYFEDELTDQIMADLKYIQLRILQYRTFWMKNMQILPIIRILSNMNLITL